MKLDLANKHAIVTGGTHGIGLATALMLAKEGCNIAISGRRLQPLLDTQKKIESYGVECLPIQADVLEPLQLQQGFDTVAKNWNQIHILINNVGGGGRWGLDDFEETPDSVWQEVYDKNLTSAMQYTKFVIPYMKKQRWGRVITITSTLGRQAGGRPWFNVAKTAQTCLMKNLSLRKDLVRYNITFNSVAPGCIMIPDTGWEEEKNKNPLRFSEMVKEKFPMGRMGNPEEVAYAIVMLCAEQASLINGTALAVDGGESYCF